MKGKHQLQRTTTIAAPREAVWSIIEDTSLLPRWVPAVSEVLELPDAEREGSVRTCAVVFGGRKGQLTERCVEFDGPRRAGYVVDGDTLGFSKMFSDYGFTLTFEQPRPARTFVTIDTYYTPRNAFVALINNLMMRRRFAKVVEALLGGLKALAEQRTSEGRQAS